MVEFHSTINLMFVLCVLNTYAPPPLVKERNFTDLYGYIYIYQHKMNKKITEYEK